jgi:light-regulated signal transduction histidine kinase (bacteriophytochrome)
MISYYYNFSGGGKMIVKAVCEYNEKGCLVYAENFPGAFVRGRNYENAIAKFPKEIESWLDWANGEAKIESPIEIELVQKKERELNVSDADSDIIFDSEREPLTKEEYQKLKILALRSAMDFERMYDSIPDKKMRIALERDNFYGKEIIIADDGVPIEENVVEHIFEPFAVGDASRRTKGGSGLGLSIAKRIVEMHGWEIDLYQNKRGYKKAFIINVK